VNPTTNPAGTAAVFRLETLEAGERRTRYYRDPLGAVTRLRRVRRCGGSVLALDAATLDAATLAAPPPVPADAWLSLLDSEEDT
jgi:hypothetical protein